MLLTARAMLAENASPSRGEVLHYLRGSLCRCTGYRKIVDAVLAAAGKAQ
jgi:carbon-monoxide dehydrogenase small subunit